MRHLDRLPRRCVRARDPDHAHEERRSPAGVDGRRGTNRARRRSSKVRMDPAARRLRARHRGRDAEAPPPSSSARARAPPRRSIARAGGGRSSRQRLRAPRSHQGARHSGCSPIGCSSAARAARTSIARRSVMAAILERSKSPAVMGSGVFRCEAPLGPAGRRTPRPLFTPLRGAFASARERSNRGPSGSIPTGASASTREGWFFLLVDHGDRHGRAQHRP